MLLVLRRAWVQVTSNRRKFGMLCAACGVALLLWARLLVISNMPRTAIAAPAQAPPAAERAGARSENRAAPSMAVEFDRSPRRDPFVISEKHFPKPTPLAEMLTDPGKSLPPAVEESERAEDRLRALVENLRLDAVMSSDSLAVIDGQTYREGDLVPVGAGDRIRFGLVEVRHRSVILAFEDHRFELKMGGPGG